MSQTKASATWREIKPFAIRDIAGMLDDGKGTGATDEYFILLYDSSSKRIKQYSMSAEGLDAALAAWTDGDVIVIPVGTISGNHTINGAVIGISRDECALSGVLTMGEGGSLRNLTVTGNIIANVLCSLSDIFVQNSSGVGLTSVGTVGHSPYIQNVHVDSLDTSHYGVDITGYCYVENCLFQSRGLGTHVDYQFASFHNVHFACSGSTINGNALVLGNGIISNALISANSGHGLSFTASGKTATVSDSRMTTNDVGSLGAKGLYVTQSGLTLIDSSWNSVTGDTLFTYGTGDRAAANHSHGATAADQMALVRFDSNTGDNITITNDSSHNGFPGLTKLADGTLIVVYRKATNHAPSKGVIYKKISSDGGKTWSSEASVYSHATADAREPCLTLLANGTLVLMFSLLDASTAAYITGDQVYIIKSTDSGATWGSPINVNNTGFTSWSYTSTPIIELANGNLIIPVYGKMTGDTFRSVRVVQSADAGATWGSSALVINGQTASKDYDEPNIVQIANGNIICAFKNLTDFRGYVSISTNNGATWGTAVNQFGTAGNPRLLRLRSDTVICHTRQNTTNSVVIYASIDGGVTWGSAYTVTTTTYDSVYSQAAEQADGLIAMAYALELVNQSDANVYITWLAESFSADGTDTVIGKSLTAYGGNIEVIGGGQFVSDAPTGTAPLKVASTTANTNLNADLLDGHHWSEIGAGSGTVTNIATGTGLSGGPITTTGTIALADTAVTPGSYSSANITVDAQGRLTSATNGTGGTGSEPLTNGDATSPEILFTDDGDVLMEG